jgi:probable rRNA maturation factor
VDPDSKRLRVTVSDGAGRRVRDGGLAGWLATIAPPRARGELAIALVSDARIRSLNRRFRRQDRMTDVLSFPASGPPSRRAEASRVAAWREAEAGGLGDVVIATGVARRQAKEAGHSFQTELRVLALHGLLHLLGYDHHDSDDHGRMARLEARLGRAGGLRTGLIQRARRPGSGRASRRRSGQARA